MSKQSGSKSGAQSSEAASSKAMTCEHLQRLLVASGSQRASLATVERFNAFRCEGDSSAPINLIEFTSWLAKEYMSRVDTRRSQKAKAQARSK